MKRFIKWQEAGRFAIALFCVVLTICMMLLSIIAFGQESYSVTEHGDTVEFYAVHTSELVGYGDEGDDHFVLYQEHEGYLSLMIYGSSKAVKKLSKHIDINAEPMAGGFHFHVGWHKKLDIWFINEASECNKKQWCKHYDQSK